MTTPLSKVRLQSSTVLWANMVVAYKIVRGCLAMTLLIKRRRVRFQLAPDGVWRRRIRRKGAPTIGARRSRRTRCKRA